MVACSAMTPAGICLAAGASSRMGSPKALVSLAGRTAVWRALTALREGGCDPVVLVLGASADEVRAAGNIPEGIRVVVHDGWATGRSGSLKAGVAACHGAPAFVILPVDHLLVAAADVAALVRAWRQDRPPLVRPLRDGRGGHPVLFDAALTESLLSLGDDEPLRHVVADHRDREVTIPGSPATRIDVNTPEDLERARALLRNPDST